MSEAHKTLDELLAASTTGQMFTSDDRPPFVRGPLKELPKATPMPHPQREIIDATIKRAQDLFAAKNLEYAGGSDILGNFRRQAGNLQVPMSTVWMILAGKHIDAIQEYVKDSRGDLMRPRTQSIAERVDDLIVYALLLQVILEEEGHA